MYDEVKSKIQNMIDGADTEMERDFWTQAMALMEEIEALSSDNALKIESNEGVLYLWKGENALQFVNTIEDKAGSKEVSEAVVLATLFIKEHGANVSVAPKSEALSEKMKIMMGR